jgi:hypothetical protein
MDGASAAFFTGDNFMTMTKILSALFIAGMTVATISAADARQGCGWGYHRGWHGHCVRNVHRAVMMAPPPRAMAPMPPPPPPAQVQTVTPPARTGIIPNPGSAICPYGYHVTAPGKCGPN